MKVEVSRIKKPGIKVSVTLARAKRAGSCISIPVHAVAKNEIASEVEPSEITIGFADTCNAIEDGEVFSCGDDSSEETVDSAVDEIICVEEAVETIEDELPEDAPDEEDLLALIEEEEAEMALQMQQQETAAHFIEDSSPIAAEAAEEPAEPDIISNSEQSAQVSQYMRYFDRRTDGEKFEVANESASGQEIICVNEESGRLSRVCGFIRNSQPAQPSDDDPADTQE